MTKPPAVPGLPCAWIWLGLVTGLAGCGEHGSTTYPVQGTVSYQGKPLPLGVLAFVPEGAKPAVCTIQADGSYSLRAVAGTHRVEVTAVPAGGQGRPDPNAEGGFDYRGVPAPKPLVPAKYNRYTTSGLEFEVRPADNTIDINLP